MGAHRVPLFCGTALAERIERVEAQLIARASEAADRRRTDASGFVIPIAGGVATFAEEGSPFNKVAGLGFAGVPSAAALDEVERAFAARGVPVQIELAHLADPALGGLLTERGYRLMSFENVLGLALGAEPERVSPPGVEVRLSGDDEFEAWLEVVADGVAHPDAEGMPSHEEFARDVVERAERDLVAAGFVRYVAVRDGSSPAAPACARRRASRSSPAPQPRPRTAAGVSTPRCSGLGSPTPQPPAATSPSSPRSLRPSLSRTRSVGASTCSTPAPSSSSGAESAVARHTSTRAARMA